MFTPFRRHTSITTSLTLLGALVVAASAGAGCASNPSAEEAAAATPDPLSIDTAVVESRPIDRFIRVTGSLTADEQAEVSAESGGRIVATPIERGTRVAAGTILVRVSPAEASAQLQEAEANAAQIQARLGLKPDAVFDPMVVPDVMNAKASLDWAEAEFARMRSLLEQKVVSYSCGTGARR